MSEKRNRMNPEIDDPMFALLKVQINNELRDTIKKMRARESDEGTVTIKILLTTEEAAIPNQSDYVEKLRINWKLTGQIVEKSQADGNVLNADQYYLTFDEEGKPYMQRIQDGQHEIDEYL